MPDKPRAQARHAYYAHVEDRDVFAECVSDTLGFVKTSPGSVVARVIKLYCAGRIDIVEMKPPFTPRTKKS